jgi:hypothetical protein
MCTCTSADHEAWMVESCASFYMTPHREWFCKYERYDGDDVFLGDEPTTKIIGNGKFNLNLMDVRIRKLYGILHISGLVKHLIYVSKIDDASVKIVFDKETCRTV